MSVSVLASGTTTPPYPSMDFSAGGWDLNGSGEGITVCQLSQVASGTTTPLPYFLLVAGGPGEHAVCNVEGGIRCRRDEEVYTNSLDFSQLQIAIARNLLSSTYHFHILIGLKTAALV